jgi:hypothetical protein
LRENYLYFDNFRTLFKKISEQVSGTVKYISVILLDVPKILILFDYTFEVILAKIRFQKHFTLFAHSDDLKKSKT